MIQSLNQKSYGFLKKLAQRIDWKCVGAVCLAFLLTRLMILVVTYFSMAQLSVPADERFFRYNPRNIIPDGLIRWDSEWYVSIARSGYTLAATAFFPLYPLLIRLASHITGNIWTSGLWISNFAFLVALFYLYAIAKQEFDDATAGRTVFYLASAPAAFFFSTVYTESIFVLFVVACMYYAINRKWVPAAIAGTLASATRLPGSLVIVFIGFEALWQQGIRFFPRPWSGSAQWQLLKEDLHKLPGAWKGLLAGLFSASGLLAYMFFLYQKFGDPLAFVHVESAWNRKMGWDWLIRLIQNIYEMHKPTGNILSGEIGDVFYLLDTLTILVLIPLVIAVLVKCRPSFGWFTLLTFVMPLMTGNPLSMRRFALGLIPCYFVLALWGKRAWVDRIIVGVSLPLQAYSLILFSHWVFAG